MERQRKGLNVKKRAILPLAVCSVILMLGMVMFPTLAWSAALTWVGTGGDNDFNTSGNWSPDLGRTPDAGDSCTINSTSSRQPQILSSATCGSLMVGTGASLMTLTFTTNKDLTITGDVSIGANGRIAPSGTPVGLFTVGGNWSDDLGTTNFTSSNLQLHYIFTGTNTTISTDESFYDVQISGTISLTSDITIDNSLAIDNTQTLTQGPNTIIMNGNAFTIGGTYSHTCSSIIEINGLIDMGNNEHYPHVIINNGGTLSVNNQGYIDCDMTLQPGGTLTVSGVLGVGGDWIHNGGTFGMSGTVSMNGVGAQIRGTTSTTFSGLTIGDGPGDSTTAILDTTLNQNLTVTADATFTINSGKSLTIQGPSSVINGTMNASGTSALSFAGDVVIAGTVNLNGSITWTQGSITSITVNAGGLLSAQGTDSSNRVTFTRSGADFYDLVIDGGVDFNEVNLYYTSSAAAGRGFAINSPGGATVNFDNVSIDFTKDRNGAVMVYWNSNRTINATGCTFDSSTYSQADGDVNVEAAQGTINFIDYGGNYAGEDKDNDNGGFANWTFTLSITKQVWVENGTAPLTSPLNGPVGSTLVFLIYVKNTNASQVTDVRINDDLDIAGFAYVPGSLVRDNGSLADTATDKQIFDTTAPGVGTSLSDALDADVASACDVSESLCPGSEADKITMGAVAGQANGTLTINGNTTFALRFKAKVK